jgi:hypothetical protein
VNSKWVGVIREYAAFENPSKISEKCENRMTKWEAERTETFVRVFGHYKIDFLAVEEIGVSIF